MEVPQHQFRDLPDGKHAVAVALSGRARTCMGPRSTPGHRARNRQPVRGYLVRRLAHLSWQDGWPPDRPGTTVNARGRIPNQTRPTSIRTMVAQKEVIFALPLHASRSCNAARVRADNHGWRGTVPKPPKLQTPAQSVL